MTDQYAKDMTQQRTYRAFAALLARDDEAIDLVQAALLIASTQYPDLDMAYYVTQLDNLARRVRTQLALPAPDLLPTLPEEVDVLHVIHIMNKIFLRKSNFMATRTIIIIQIIVC